MIQNCLIRREMAKNKFGRRRRFSAAAAVNGGKTNVSLYIHSYMVITYHHTQNKICKVNRRPRKHTKLGFKNRHLVILLMFALVIKIRLIGIFLYDFP